MAKRGSKRMNVGALIARNARFQSDLRSLILRRMSYGGEKSLILARENGNYTDRTGNLRNSIGYVVIDDSTKVADECNASKEPIITGTENLQTAAEACDEAKGRLIQGVETDGNITLEVVAGMNYATFVEAKGYEVLSNTRLSIERTMNDGIKKDFQKVARKYGTNNRQ